LNWEAHTLSVLRWVLGSSQGIHPANLEVYLQRCPCCKFSDPILTVSSISKDLNGNPKLKQVAQGVLSLSQYNKFHEAVTQNLPLSGEPNAIPTNDDEISLGQQERCSIVKLHLVYKQL
jgi:hypothetical protein